MSAKKRTNINFAGTNPVVVKPWQDKQERLTGYFQFTTDMRRMAYTANASGAIIATYGK